MLFNAGIWKLLDAVLQRNSQSTDSKLSIARTPRLVGNPTDLTTLGLSAATLDLS